uniref:Uncharacterized protein n=1 Tax=Moniliophthora roreri TaxID=221103 RepID=A0A0W0FEP8_MONRR
MSASRLQLLRQVSVQGHDHLL